MEEAVTSAIEASFGIQVVAVDRVHGGTASDNFVVSERAGRRWFAKIYRSPAELVEAEAAIALASFARDGGVPVPQVHRTRGDDVITQVGDLALSLWDFVGDAETAEGRITGRRWQSVGEVVGRLHARLAVHPAVRPALRSPAQLVDLVAAAARYDRLITTYRQQPTGGDYEEWALEAAILRRSLLPRVAALLDRLPELSVQVLHGDLAAPNVLLRGDDVAAIIDFQPAHPGFVAWEVARIACDPRTIVADDSWVTSLPVLLDAYRASNPLALDVDIHIDSVVALGCAYTLTSTYPLAEPLKARFKPGCDQPVSDHRVSERADEGLQRYGRARHQAALLMLDHLGV